MCAQRDIRGRVGSRPPPSRQTPPRPGPRRRRRPAHGHTPAGEPRRDDEVVVGVGVPVPEAAERPRRARAEGHPVRQLGLRVVREDLLPVAEVAPPGSGAPSPAGRVARHWEGRTTRGRGCLAPPAVHGQGQTQEGDLVGAPRRRDALVRDEGRGVGPGPLLTADVVHAGPRRVPGKEGGEGRRPLTLGTDRYAPTRPGDPWTREVVPPFRGSGVGGRGVTIPETLVLLLSGRFLVLFSPLLLVPRLLPGPHGRRWWLLV